MIFIFSQGEVGRVAGDDRSYGFDRKSECLGSVCDGDFILRGGIGASGDDEVGAFGEAFVGVDQVHLRIHGLIQLLELAGDFAVCRGDDLLALQVFEAVDVIPVISDGQFSGGVVVDFLGVDRLCGAFFIVGDLVGDDVDLAGFHAYEACRRRHGLEFKVDAGVSFFDFLQDFHVITGEVVLVVHVSEGAEGAAGGYDVRLGAACLAFGGRGRSVLVSAASCKGDDGSGSDDGGCDFEDGFKLHGEVLSIRDTIFSCKRFGGCCRGASLSRRFQIPRIHTF